MATKKLKEENELLRSEIEGLKNQLYKISEDLKTQQATAASKPSRTAEAKQAKDTVERTNSEERAEAVVFMSKQYDDLEVFRKQATQDIRQITKKLDSISKKCDEITEAIELAEQYSYQYNIKIMGVPQLNEKESAETTANLCIKLFTAMGVTDVSLQDIDIAHRVQSRRPSQNSNPIICKFVRRLAKEKIMAARKDAFDNITPDQLGIELAYPSTTRISMFDHLTPRLQNLLYETKRYKTSKGYKFCWARNSQVYLRKSENTGVIRIKTPQDLTNLIEQESLR
ncbi:Hypothetical predicted protein [Paramuricea clavata]|uniref:FP protein C-terminal domain-containing protein n=1 Tax=Paramuricea clavata TaxID=317549 RepID=A0A6S7KAI2_PARCT|nr:Hypothetical predicted protein [Paramuricea clavata]